MTLHEYAAAVDARRSRRVRAVDDPERQQEGIAIAKAAGKYKGRKASLSHTQASELRERLAKGESVTTLATEYGVSRQTVYNYKIA